MSTRVISPGEYTYDSGSNQSTPSNVYTAGDGSSVAAVYATEGALPSNAGAGTLAFVTGTNKLYIRVGGVWRRSTNVFVTF